MIFQIFIGVFIIFVIGPRVRDAFISDIKPVHSALVAGVGDYALVHAQLEVRSMRIFPGPGHLILNGFIHGPQVALVEGGQGLLDGLKIGGAGLAGLVGPWADVGEAGGKVKFFPTLHHKCHLKFKV